MINRLKIEIITVNYNSEALLGKFIESLILQDYIHWELLIVNNSQKNNKINKIINYYNDERINLFNINKNVGYAVGNNQGFYFLENFRSINSESIILFSNPDIYLKETDIISKSIDYIKKNNCDFFGLKILNPDGTFMLPHIEETNYIKCIMHIGNNGVIDRIFNINKALKKVNSPINVFSLNGSFFFAKANSFKISGLFDPDIFLFYEEEILFRNAKKNKMKVIYSPEILVYHNHSATLKKEFKLLEIKKILFYSELYFLKNILKINKFFLYIFQLERHLEQFFIKILEYLKSGKSIN